MSNNNMKRRINVREFADRLACHPATVKRMIRRKPPQFPAPVLINGKYTWTETEADQYEQYLIEQSRKGSQDWA
jgi:predicted DNA-binding transcriptional regulator AlpA